MKLLRFYIFLLLAVVCLPLFAQLKFVQKEYDFGKCLCYTPSEVIVNVINRGNESVQLADVRSSNSAVTLDFSRVTILPGAAVNVKVKITPTLVGFFDYTLAVYTDAQTDYLDEMHLKGMVIMSELEAGEGNVAGFPYHVGKIYLSTDNIEFDEVNKGSLSQQFIKVYNAGSDIYRPEMMHLPKYLSVLPIPEAILPGHSGKLVFTLDGGMLPSMGLNQTNIYVSRFSGDNVGRENEFAVSAVLIPSIDSLSVNKEQAPKIEYATNVIEVPAFGKKKTSKTKTYIKNTGKQTLEINALQVFNPAVEVKLSSARIEPGGIAELTVVLNKTLMGQFHSKPRVLMITNDPLHTKVLLDVKENKNLTQSRGIGQTIGRLFGR